MAPRRARSTRAQIQALEDAVDDVARAERPMTVRVFSTA